MELLRGREQVVEGGNDAGKGYKSKHHKKRVPGRCLVSCSGTLLLLDDNVVDKLFSF